MLDNGDSTDGKSKYVSEHEGNVLRQGEVLHPMIDEIALNKAKRQLSFNNMVNEY